LSSSSKIDRLDKLYSPGGRSNQEEKHVPAYIITARTINHPKVTSYVKNKKFPKQDLRYFSAKSNSAPLPAV